jgi:cytochrome P450
MATRPPVSDWSTDWDHLDERWQEDPYPIWEALRATCPVAHTDRYLGVYLPTRYEDVKAVAYDTEHFSSRRVIVREERPELSSPSPAPPITSDPPDHKPAKQMLLPFFTPDAVRKLEPVTRAVCRELIDRFAGEPRIDAAQAYSRHIPVRVITHMLGIPESDSAQFIVWLHQILELGVTDRSQVKQAAQEMNEYFSRHIERIRGEGGDNLIGELLAVRQNGEPLSMQYLLGALQLLLLAGIDTTWSAVGASLWHLARQPADRRRLVAEPQLMPLAVEEFLRAYAPVTMAREVVKETTLGGCPIRPGNMLLLSFPAANRDPAMFADADKVIIDRTENRHLAFGIGIHRCVGSNLARMEMTVAIEEFLKRIPEFSLDPSREVTWSQGPVRGPRSLPLVLGAVSPARSA